MPFRTAKPKGANNYNIILHQHNETDILDTHEYGCLVIKRRALKKGLIGCL